MSVICHDSGFGDRVIVGDEGIEKYKERIRDELYKNRSSRKIDSRRLFSREYDFPKTFSLAENRVSATVKKCVFVEDGFKCLRESIFSVFYS